MLALAAVRLGFRPVDAIDFEAASVRAARENAAANGVEVAVRQADLLAEPPPAAATLAANVPLAVHRALGAWVAPEVQRVIVSGIVDREAEPALAAYAGLHATVVRETAGWHTMLLERR